MTTTTQAIEALADKAKEQGNFLLELAKHISIIQDDLIVQGQMMVGLRSENTKLHKMIEEGKKDFKTMLEEEEAKENARLEDGSDLINASEKYNNSLETEG